MPLTAEQLNLRRHGITASDISKIVGESPYGGPIDVLIEKQAEGLPAELTSDRVKWGNILEDPIRDDYALRHGVNITVPGTLTHPDESWALATPDGLVYHDNYDDTPDRGLEIKTHTVHLSHKYGPPGSDEVPAHEFLQCAWNMYVTDLNQWDLVAFIDGLPTDYEIRRDKELEEMIVEEGRVFWTEHVQGGAPLSPDGSEAYSRYVDALFPRHDIGYRVAGPEFVATIDDLRVTRSQVRELQQQEKVLTQTIKEFIGENAGVEFRGPTGDEQRISWKRAKGRIQIDWQAIAQDYRNQIELLHSGTSQPLTVEIKKKLDDVITRHSTRGNGTRRFYVPRSWSK